MTDEVWVHLPPQAGSPPWRRSFALDLATRDGGDASGVFRRAEAYLAWLAGEQGGEFEALGHPEATNSPRTTADKGVPGTTPQDGAQCTVLAALATNSVVGALRDALASDDPDVVREAAESLGLTEEEWDIRGAHGSSCVTSWRTLAGRRRALRREEANDGNE